MSTPGTAMTCARDGRLAGEVLAPEEVRTFQQQNIAIGSTVEIVWGFVHTVNYLSIIDESLPDRSIGLEQETRCSLRIFQLFYPSQFKRYNFPPLE